MFCASLRIHDDPVVLILNDSDSRYSNTLFEPVERHLPFTLSSRRCRRSYIGMSSPRRHVSPHPKSRPTSHLLSTPSQAIVHVTPSRAASPVLQASVQLPPSSFVEHNFEPSEVDSASVIEGDGEGPLESVVSPEESIISASPSPSHLTDDNPLAADSASQVLRDQLRRTLSTHTASSTRSTVIQAHRRGRVVDEEGNDVEAVTFPPLSETEAEKFEDRKYFVLTNAGKPVFRSQVDDSDEEATNTMGIMQALISVFAEDGDKIRYIVAGSTRITFLLRPPLYYVCVSSWGEPAPITKTHLEYLHLQILSTLTQPQLTKLFERRGNFDLGRLLSGAYPLMRSLLENSQISMDTTLSALQSLRMDAVKRRKVGEAMIPTSKMKDMLYALLIAQNRVITLVRPRKHSINPSDLHILLNTLASPSLLIDESESWLPICLPRFNASGFLYAYVGAIKEGVGLVGMCADRDAWDTIREWSVAVTKKFEDESLIGAIEQAAAGNAYSAGELGIPGLWHFVYKSRAHVQFTQPQFDAPYDSQIEQRRLITLYQQVHDALHARSGQQEPLTLQYIRTDREAIMGWITKPFELYLALSPQLEKPACVSAANAVVHWAKKEEGRLFLKDAPVF